MSKFDIFLKEEEESVNEYGANLTSIQIDAIRKKENLPNPDLYDPNSGKTKKKGHSTQVSNTVNTYQKIHTLIHQDHLAGVGLDYSAGLGHGTEFFRKSGHDMESYEVNPPTDEREQHITYKGHGSLPKGKTYDYIICSCVLNVVPIDIRNTIVKDIWSHLNEGGSAYITVRGNDVMTVTNPVMLSKSNMEVLVRASGAYQKGFTKPELREYIREQLPTAIVTGLPMSTAAVKVTKHSDVSAGVSRILAKHLDTPNLDELLVRSSNVSNL